MLHSALLNVMIAAARKAGARAQARLRRSREPAGLAERARPISSPPPTPRRGDPAARNCRKARPGYGFSARKAAGARAPTRPTRWIVDPLDGTTNFLHGIPQFAISIALEREGAIVAGVVYNPANEELFIAERGKGAFLNDQRLRVAARRAHGRGGGRLRAAASRPRRSRAVPQGIRRRAGARSPGCAASAPPRSISPGWRPAGSTPIGSATSRPGTWRPASSWCARPAASSPTSTAATAC